MGTGIRCRAQERTPSQSVEAAGPSARRVGKMAARREKKQEADSDKVAAGRGGDKGYGKSPKS